MFSYKKLFIAMFVLMFIVVPVFVHAQDGNTPPTNSGDVHIPNPLKNGVNNFIDLVKLVLDTIIMPIASILVVVFIIYSGFKFVTAQGNPGKIAEAQQRLLWALIGAGVLLGAWGISQVIQNTVTGLITP